MIVNKSFENVTKFTHQEVTITNQNYINEKMKSKLYSGNACYHSVQNRLTSFVWFGRETWFFTLKEENTFEGV
jgi:hypothetical protein